MISTKNYSSLPDRKSLETICKSISVLDAIISQEWQYRYYSYNSRWDTNERCLQMRNGSGNEMHILFREDGCAINGFAHEYEQQDKVKLTNNLPTIFKVLTSQLGQSLNIHIYKPKCIRPPIVY